MHHTQYRARAKCYLIQPLHIYFPSRTIVLPCGWTLREKTWEISTFWAVSDSVANHFHTRRLLGVCVGEYMHVTEKSDYERVKESGWSIQSCHLFSSRLVQTLASDSKWPGFDTRHFMHIYQLISSGGRLVSVHKSSFGGLHDAVACLTCDLFLICFHCVRICTRLFYDGFRSDCRKPCKTLIINLCIRLWWQGW